MTSGVADAILASLYLNAQVYTGTVTANGLTPGAAKWQNASDAADRVLNSGADTRGELDVLRLRAGHRDFVVHLARIVGGERREAGQCEDN